ncbi:uncharacterized protein LOC135960007 [Calliphora vicina]|uniref:uncharacterized protein LOC135960007 n=1 Tax=Calliphora vicina TaxID=7373 RepID=UPI00325A7514
MNLTTLIIAIVTLLGLQKPLTLCTKEDSFLYDYIAAFPYLRLMQDVVWFISEQLDGEQNERCNQLIMNIANFTQLTQFVWTQLRDVRMIKIQSKRGYIGIVVTTGAEDPIMLVHNRLLIGRHYSITFVVYAGKAEDLTAIRELCYLLYQGNFVNSVVYFQTERGQSMVYSMDMYPVFKIVNSTDYKLAYEKLTQRIHSASQDVQRYRFHTPIKQDIPGVFQYKNRKGKAMLQGSTYSILKTFVSSINGVLVPYEGPSNNSNQSNIVNMKEVLDLVRSKQIEISAHAYALFQPDDDLDKSYPLMVVKWCLMIPLRNSISTFFYTLQPFEWKVWCLILGALMGLCFKDLINMFCNSETTELWPLVNRSWLNNLCHILNISPSRSISIKNPKSFLYYFTVFSFGFFLCAFYTSYLGSSLTVSLFRAQINTLSDLIAANLTVLIIDYELEFLLGEGYQPSPEFFALLKPVDSATFYQHQIALNSSYAYFITDDRWLFLHESQKHLKLKRFKFSDICFGSYHLAYPLQTDSPIWRDLEYFLFHLHSSGLFYQYELKALQYVFTPGNLERLQESETYTSAGLEHLLVVFYMLAVMYAVAVISLLIEILYYNRKNIKRFLKN